MPSKQRPTVRANPSTNGQFEFINVDLSVEQQKALKAKPFSYDDADDILLKLTEAGYKVTFSYDERRTCYSAFMMQRESKHDNYGFMLSGKGSSPLKALKQVSYIHFVLLNETWTDHATRNPAFEIDD